MTGPEVRTEVFFGPRTRLAQALLNTPKPVGTRRLVVVRNDADTAELTAAGHPDLIHTDLIHTDGTASNDAATEGDLRIVICALGPVHPVDDPSQSADIAHAHRDFSLIDRLLAGRAGAKTELVYVSSALALAPEPRPERRYYTAWKQTVERELEQIAAATEGTKLTVLYPGRLVEHAKNPALALMHTPYHRLARKIAAPRRTDGYRSVVGLDARLWLLARRVTTNPGVHLPAESADAAVLRQALPCTYRERL